MPVIPVLTPAVGGASVPALSSRRRRCPSPPAAERTAQTGPGPLVCSDSETTTAGGGGEFAQAQQHTQQHTRTRRHAQLLHATHEDKMMMMTASAVHMQQQAAHPAQPQSASRAPRSGGGEPDLLLSASRSRKSSLDILEQAQMMHGEDAKRMSPHATAAAGKRMAAAAVPPAAPVSGASLRPSSRGPSPSPLHTNPGSGGGMHAPSRSMGGSSGVEAAYAELKRRSRSRAPSLDLGLLLPMHGALPSLVSVVPALPARPQPQPARIAHHAAAAAGATVRAWQATEQDYNHAPRAAISAAAADTLNLVSPRTLVSRPLLHASSRTRPSSPLRASPLPMQVHGAPSPVPDEKMLSPLLHRPFHARSASGRMSPTQSLPRLGGGQMGAVAAAVSSACSSPALRARRLSIGGGISGGAGGFRESDAPPRMSFSSSAAVKARPVKPLPLELPLGGSGGNASSDSACHSGLSSSQASPNGSSSASASSAVAASMMLFRSGGGGGGSVASSPTASCVSTPGSASSFSGGAGQQFYAIKSPPSSQQQQQQQQQQASAAPIPTATTAGSAASAFASASSKAATARAYAFLRAGGGGGGGVPSLNASPNVTPNLQTRQLARLEARAADSLNSSPALMSRRLSVQPQPLQPLGSLTPRLEHLQRRAGPAAAATAAATDDAAVDSHSPLRSLGRAKHARGLSLSVVCGEGFLASMPALSHHHGHGHGHAAGSSSTASASPLSSSSSAASSKSQSQSLSPASASSVAARSAPSSGSVGPASSSSSSSAASAASSLARVGRAASDDDVAAVVCAPMSPLSVGIAPLARHVFEKDMPVLATTTLSDLAPLSQRQQPQPLQQRQRRPMVAPILLAPPAAAISAVTAALSTAIESLPSPSVPAMVAPAPAASAVAAVPALAVPLAAGAAAGAAASASTATPLFQSRRRFIPPPITLPVDLPDDFESTPLTASPVSHHEENEDDAARMSPSPVCSPTAAAAATAATAGAFVAATPAALPLPAATTASFVLPDVDLIEGGSDISIGMGDDGGGGDCDARRDRKASLGLLSRRGRFDDEDSDAALLRDVQTATAMAAASSPVAPTLPSSGAAPSSFFGMGLCGDFVLPDAPRASFSNYARAVLDEASLDSPAIQPSPLQSPLSGVASDDDDADAAQQEAHALAHSVAAAAAAAAASPHAYDEEDAYEDGDDEREDDAVDFWEAMDSGAYRLF